MALFGKLAGSLVHGSSNHLVYKGDVIIRKTNVLDVANAGASILDNAADLVGLGVTLKLISSSTGKTSNAASLEKWLFSTGLFATDEVKYSVKFTVDADFGIPGAFSIRNSHPSELYLVSVTVELPGGGKNIAFPCYSWVYNAALYKTDRIFFSNELYLPSDTPKGLANARQSDLQALRGDGTGIRQTWDRIYDYDVYHDLGSTLLNIHRPVLGGSELPYPRRCRTGRITVNGAETNTLTPLNAIYVPSDERFGSVKSSVFLADGLKGLTHSVLPALEGVITFDQTFDSLKEIKNLYDHGLDITKFVSAPIKGLQTPSDFFNEFTADTGNTSFMKFPVPQVFQVNEKGWMSDDEFAREMLSGVNPIMIQRLQEFPPTSTLDPETYGPSKSAITEEHLADQLEGLTVEQALNENKLFILSYHDEFMPYLNRMNSQNSTYVYAPRALLFLRSDGTLKPVAIELSTPFSRRVFVPPASGGTVDWVWELAKAHVATVDSVHHQLVSHWLRTHACIEPFIIATNRQLSKLHPLNPFLQPHFKNTMTINARARQSLINANGIIELCFSPGQYCMELSAVVYKGWRFDEQGLPADLIKRGMAVPDSTAKHGLKLVIEDYPYAADGLEIWSALEKWTMNYLNACYKDDAAVANDTELQAWWKEAIAKGHVDKKDESWWIKLDSKKNLALALTTIIWVGSAHHAAVNFGQYAYNGYMPNHATSTHRAIPEENTPEHAKLLENPEKFFLESVSRKLQAILVMLTLEVLSTHATDEEYLGQRTIANWTSNSKAIASFNEFTAAMKKVEGVVTSRNADSSLKNRTGPVNVPYTLLFPASGPGMTGKGVPNSISI